MWHNPDDSGGEVPLEAGDVHTSLIVDTAALLEWFLMSSLCRSWVSCSSIFKALVAYLFAAVHCVGSRVQFVMGGRRASRPRWGAITVRRVLLSRPPPACTPHSMDFSRFLSQLLATEGWAVGNHGSLFSFKMQFSWVQVRWCTTNALEKVNRMPPILQGKVIYKTFE